MTYTGGTLPMPKISLQPYQSSTVNVRDVMRAGLLPPGATYGGFRIFGTPSNTRIVVKEHVISERMRMATPFYGSPRWVDWVYVSQSALGGECNPSPPAQCNSPQYNLELDQTANIWLITHWTDGGDIAVTGSIWSNDPNVATVVGWSSDSHATITAVSPGNTYIDASVSNVPINQNGDLGSLASINVGGVQSFTRQIPTSLRVTSVTKIQLNQTGGCSTTPVIPGNPSTAPQYGARVGVQYQVLDQNTQPINNNGMVPQEWITDYFINGQPQQGTPGFAPLGPSEVPGTSFYTNAQGQFYDAPVGTCANQAITVSFSQHLAIAWGQNRYPVRTQTITITSQGITPGQGTINNSYNDISATLP